MGGEDQELRDAEPRWELSGFYLGHWKRFVLDSWGLGGFPLIQPPAVRGCVSDYGVLRGSGSGRRDFLVATVLLAGQIVARVSSIHKIDQPSLKRPFRILRRDGCSCFDEERDADLDAVQQTSHIGVCE